MAVRPSIALGSLPVKRSWLARFKFAASVGFEGIEVGCAPGEVDAISDAAAATGLTVHSVYSTTNWRQPLSSGDPDTLRAGISSTLAAIESAHRLGADTILLIPGVVDRDTSYLQAYARSQAVIRAEILPAARELGITLAIENVWNGMLLGPLEYTRFLDELDSPHARALLDLGNVIIGRCEDWIEIAGTRIVQLHIKDSRFSHRWGKYRSCRIGEGEVDWHRVRGGLDAIGFSGWATVAGAERSRLGTHIVYYAAAHAPERLLSSVPGLRQLLYGAQHVAGRRMLTDASRRFRRHVAPPLAASEPGHAAPLYA
jgi:hexulose-6-phosphate isomerase